MHRSSNFKDFFAESLIWRGRLRMPTVSSKIKNEGNIKKLRPISFLFILATLMWLTHSGCSGMGGGGMGASGLPTAPSNLATSEQNTPSGNPTENNDPTSPPGTENSGQYMVTGLNRNVGDNTSFGTGMMAQSGYAPYVNIGSEGHPSSNIYILVAVGIKGERLVMPSNTLTDEEYEGHCMDFSINKLDPFPLDHRPTVKIQVGSNPDSKDNWINSTAKPFDYYEARKCDGSGFCETNTCGFSNYPFLWYTPNSMWDSDGNCIRSFKATGSYTRSGIQYYGETIATCAELKAGGFQVNVILEPK